MNPNTCKQKLGDGVEASVTRKANWFDCVVWDHGECIWRGSYPCSETFIILEDVFDQLTYEFVDKARMVCCGEDGPSDADMGL